MTTEEILVQRYGATMSFGDLAEVLKSKSPNAVRVRLHGRSVASQKLRGIRKQHGRRVYFLTVDVAALLVQGIAEDARR